MDTIVRVLVASDQPLLRESLCRIVLRRPTFQLVSEVARGEAVIEALERLRPDVALLEAAMEGLDAARMLQAIGRDGLPTRVVMMGEDRVGYEALSAGALGFLTERATTVDVDRAIGRAACGQATIHPDAHTEVARRIFVRERAELPSLSPRERQVLELAADGVSLPSKAAARLMIAPTTVRTHWFHIYEKLHVSDRAAAVAVAVRLGIVA